MIAKIFFHPHTNYSTQAISFFFFHNVDSVITSNAYVSNLWKSHFYFKVTLSNISNYRWNRTEEKECESPLPGWGGGTRVCDVGAPHEVQASSSGSARGWVQGQVAELWDLVIEVPLCSFPPWLSLYLSYLFPRLYIRQGKPLKLKVSLGRTNKNSYNAQQEGPLPWFMLSDRWVLSSSSSLIALPCQPSSTWVTFSPAASLNWTVETGWPGEESPRFGEWSFGFYSQLSILGQAWPPLSGLSCSCSLQRLDIFLFWTFFFF